MKMYEMKKSRGCDQGRPKEPPSMQNWHGNLGGGGKIRNLGGGQNVVDFYV